MSATGTCPRLIEVALPIREISAECVRQKSAQRGHISTLHIWLARRPLAAARAVVFASLVPDPDDSRCPVEFRELVDKLLKTEVPSGLRVYFRGRDAQTDPDPYRPYDGIPDTLRNRLLAFIAKWSPEKLAFEGGRSRQEPKTDILLDDRSLVKWETSDRANEQGAEVLRIARALVRAAYAGRTPIVLDPFAGGGAIPLEAGRLGCQAIANDYNPVSYLILRATCEFPQKYGKPGRRKVDVHEFGKTQERNIDVSNVLAHDVEKWANWILERARQRLSPLYPPGKDGRPTIAYVWLRTAPCSNPSCRGEIPLIRNLVICDKAQKRVALTMHVDKRHKQVSFGIARDNAIRVTDGTKRERGPAVCPYCDQKTSEKDLRKAGRDRKMGERLAAVITEGENGKEYRPVEETDRIAFATAASIDVERPNEVILPEINAPDAEEVSNSTGIRVHLYGMKTWGSLFNPRQLVSMQTFLDCYLECLDCLRTTISDEHYRLALIAYLAIWISRNSSRMTTVGRWNISEETVATPFSVQGVPMKWDYPEANPFSNVSGGFANQTKYILSMILRESTNDGSLPCEVTLGDAARLKLAPASVDVSVTDPPYFDEMAYADISDFFYVWLKRALSAELPGAFAFPQTPKADEATSLLHRHRGDADTAEAHFVAKLTDSLKAIRGCVRSDGITSIMFAHQENRAWNALVRSILGAQLNIMTTWPIETERKNRPVALDSSALETSITVSCRTRTIGAPAASFKDVRGDIASAVGESATRFWNYGLRGADLLVSCYGPAVSVFGEHEHVEKADGTRVEIPELLDLARIAARDTIAGEFRGDSVSTLYYLWVNLFGVAEQKWDDARLLVQIGGDDEDAMDIARRHGIFIVDGSQCRIALLADRNKRRNLGMEPDAPLVDALHRAMMLWKQEKRADLLAYLIPHDLLTDDRFWKLAHSLFDVLPRDLDDWKLVNALLSERETLQTEGKRSTVSPVQRALDLR